MPDLLPGENRLRSGLFDPAPQSYERPVARSLEVLEVDFYSC